jgi:Fe-S-cluster containining protein
MDAPVFDEPAIALDHPRFRSVWASIFTRKLAADCMTHQCTMVLPDPTNTEVKLDACCQYGCDVVRTEVHDDGCLFLAHDKRGCAIHRASLEQGWDFRGVKPAICRLFPISYEEDAIVIADEAPEYSCAHVEGPTLYRITRDALGDIFGPELVVALDAAEAQVLAAVPRGLPVLR